MTVPNHTQIAGAAQLLATINDIANARAVLTENVNDTKLLIDADENQDAAGYLEEEHLTRVAVAIDKELFAVATAKKAALSELGFNVGGLVIAPALA